jgi:hypothetical protein
MKKFTLTWVTRRTTPTLLAAGLCLLGGALSQAASVPQAATVRAAPPGTAVELPALSVSEIVARNATARGGLPAWQAVNAMSMVGTLEAGKPRKDGGVVATTNLSKQDRAKARAEMRKALQDGSAQAKPPASILLPFTLDMKRPVLQRLEVPFQGQTAIQVFDGSQGWKLRPYLGRHEVEAFNGDELRVAKDQQPLEGALLNYQAKGTQVALEGGELIEGRGAYRLKLTLKNGDVLHTWIDAQNFLDMKIDGAPRRWDGRMHGVATYFRDYKAVDGLMIAHRLETVVEGVSGSENIYVQKVSLNPLLSNDHFARPQ